MGKTICAWCKRVLVEDNGFDADSHGICKKCHRELRKDPDKVRKQQEKAHGK